MAYSWACDVTTEQVTKPEESASETIVEKPKAEAEAEAAEGKVEASQSSWTQQGVK